MFVESRLRIRLVLSDRDGIIRAMGDTSSRSKGASFGSGCLSLVINFALLGVVTYTLMAPLRPAGLRLGMALVSALLLTLGLRSFWSLAWGEHGAKSLETLIRRARKGEPPQDGEPVVADGVVRPLASALTAPLSGVPCAAYWYTMYYLGRSSRGSRRPIEVPVYWGYACRPFAIDSSVARLRVLAIPLLHADAEPRQGPDAIERARQLVKTTAFEPVAPLATLGAIFELARDTFSDEDGEARRDWKREGDERDPETLLLKETLLPVGAAASVHGLWSAERGAIVSEGSALGTAVSVVLGRSEKLKGVPGVGHSTRAYLVTATLLTALGIGLVWFALSVLPTLL